MANVVASRMKAGDLVIPGGWKIHVPEISIAREDARFQRLLRVIEEAGATPLHAEALARKGCEDLFQGRWVTATRQFVARWAEVHREVHGDLARFAPEEIGGYFVPAADVWLKGRTNFVMERRIRKV